MQAGWGGWRRVSGLICHRRITKKSERECLYDSSEACYGAWFGDSDNRAGSNSEGGHGCDRREAKS